MRRAFLFLLLCCAVLLVTARYNQETKNFLVAVAQGAHDLWYTKEIRITGVRRIDENELRERLPLDRAVWWWHANRSQILAPLLADSAILSAELDGCSDSRIVHPGCFSLKITEREPHYLIKLGEVYWLFGVDGTALAPATRVGISETLPRLTGIDRTNSSPEQFKSRFDYVVSALNAVQQETALVPQYAELRENGELEVGFRGQEFAALFEFDDRGGARITEQARRLALLVDEVGSGISQIERIDLAFERSAVAKMKAQLKAPAAKK